MTIVMTKLMALLLVLAGLGGVLNVYLVVASDSSVTGYVDIQEVS